MTDDGVADRADDAAWGHESTVARAEFDLRYLDRSAEDNRRYYFSFIADHAAGHLLRGAEASVADIGCATGAFLGYVLDRFGPRPALGIDASPELVAAARQQVRGAEFAVGDVSNVASLPRRRFDVVAMATLNSHFDGPEEWLPGVVGLIAPGGIGLVFGLFNPYDVDVAVRVRYAAADRRWLSGWSVQSRHGVSRALRERGIAHRFIDFAVGQDIVPTPADPLRSWSQRLHDGTVQVLNGSGLLHPFALLEIAVPAQAAER